MQGEPLDELCRLFLPFSLLGNVWRSHWHWVRRRETQALGPSQALEEPPQGLYGLLIHLHPGDLGPYLWPEPGRTAVIWAVASGSKRTVLSVFNHVWMLALCS